MWGDFFSLSTLETMCIIAFVIIDISFVFAVISGHQL